MSLLEDAHKSFKGLVGYEEPRPQPKKPRPQQIDYAKLYAQRGGVMDESVQSPVDVHHKGLSETFGENIHDTDRLLGSKSAWKEFANQTSKTFKEFGLKVDKKRFFPTKVHLSSSEGRDIPYGTATEGKDFHEMNWLNKDRNTNIAPRFSGGWSLIPKSSNRTDAGLLGATGLTSPSFDSYNPWLNSGDNTYVGVSRKGASLSRGTPSTPDTTETFAGGAPDFSSYDVTTKGTASKPAEQNITGHEYGHYMDIWMGNGTPLSDIAMSLGVNTMQPTANDWYVAWMNDPRTAHLDVVDKINTADHPNEKLNNPREILGKFFVTAMLNPTRINGQPFDPNPTTNMSENIVRAMGVFFNPDQTDDEGHIQGIKDMRGNVIGAIANLLNQ